MQFKGSLRSPGDRGPGIRVFLEVDEYHLQIRRGPDLMGRWYLAEVEVVRDIAERFKLFLGDDEMEFLADDALVFAYEGVTRMQQGWLNAQKKKRRHRRAAAEAARRKDEAPDEELPVPTPAATEPTPGKRPAAKAPSSELAKKLAAIAAAEEADSVPHPARSARFSWAEAEPEELAASEASSLSWVTAREEMAIRREEADTVPEPIEAAKPAEELAKPIEESSKPSATSRLRRRSSTAPETPSPWLEGEPVGREPEPQPEPEVHPVWAEPEPAEGPEPSWVIPAEALANEPEPAWIAPDPPPANDLRMRYEALGEAARTNGDLRPGEEEIPAVDEPETRPRRGLRPRREDDSSEKSRRGRKQADKARPEEVPAAPIEEAKPAELSRAEARMEGHHPIESSTGLLGKLRRPPKLADDHVHVFLESRSAVGLTRRVCIECSHVSISADE